MSQVRTLYRGGSRYYIDPSDDRTKRPGVTSVLDKLAKPFLSPWAAKMTAELAIDSLAFIERMAENDRAGAIKYLSGASRRYTTIRANFGTEAHDLFERMIRGEEIRSVAPDMEHVHRHFAEFLAAVNPELVRAEDVVWSERYDYAGSFDAILVVWLDAFGLPTPDRSGTPRVVIVDWKTSKDTHAEVAMQLAAYAEADYILDADGRQFPIPEITGAYVLHITDKGWNFHPIEMDLREAFRYFLYLRGLFGWDADSRGAIGKAIAGSGQIVTGTQRRAK